MIPNRAALLSAAAFGATVALAMPDEWTNLATTPWYAGWFVAPSFLAYAILAVATLTDFVSNGGANPYWLKALWTLSGALTMTGYALAEAAVVRCLRRGCRWRGSGEEQTMMHEEDNHEQ